MKIIFLIFLIFLTGCNHNPEIKDTLIIRTEYIIRTAPEELKKLPVYPDGMETDNLNGLDVATWIVVTEKYILELESKFNILIEFYEKPIVESNK